MAQHTPGTALPWQADDKVYPWWSGEQPGCMVRVQVGSTGHALANCLTQYAGYPGAEANARYIVHACNLYPELVEALEAINDGHLPDQPASSSLDEYEWAVQHIRRLRAIARAVLAKAKSEALDSREVGNG